MKLENLTKNLKDVNFFENLETRDFGFSNILLMQRASKLLDENKEARPGDIITSDFKHIWSMDKNQSLDIVPVKVKKYWQVFKIDKDNPAKKTYSHALNFLDHNGGYEELDSEGNTLNYILTYTYFVFLVDELKEDKGIVPYTLSMNRSKFKAAGLINQNAELALRNNKFIIASLKAFEEQGENPYFNYRVTIKPHKELETILKNIKNSENQVNTCISVMIEASKEKIVNNETIESEGKKELKQVVSSHLKELPENKSVDNPKTSKKDQQVTMNFYDVQDATEIY